MMDAIGSKLQLIPFVWLLWGCLYLHTYAYNYDYMEEICNKTGYNVVLEKELHTYGYVKLVRTPGYSPNLDCLITIIAPSNYQMMVRFRKLEIYKPTSYCYDSDYLELFGYQDTHLFCGFNNPTSLYVSTSDRLNLKFVSGDHAELNGPNDWIGYELYYTSFHNGYCDTGEGGTEYKCKRGGHCIPIELTCDGRDNCGDWSDEKSSVCGMPTGSIVMITLICVLIGGTCIAAAVFYVIDSKKDRRRGSRNSRQRSSNVTPAYTIDYSRNQPGMMSPQEPPPYSQTPPEYVYEEKQGQLPAYDNQAYTWGGQSTGQVETSTAGQTTGRAEPSTAGQTTGRAETSTTGQTTGRAETSTTGQTTGRVEPLTTGVESPSSNTGSNVTENRQTDVYEELNLN